MRNGWKLTLALAGVALAAAWFAPRLHPAARAESAAGPCFSWGSFECCMGAGDAGAEAQSIPPAPPAPPEVPSRGYRYADPVVRQYVSRHVAPPHPEGLTWTIAYDFCHDRGGLPWADAAPAANAEVRITRGGTPALSLPDGTIVDLRLDAVLGADAAVRCNNL